MKIKRLQTLKILTKPVQVLDSVRSISLQLVLLPLIEFAYNNSYRRLLECRHMKHFMDESASCPCIGTTSVRTNVGAEADSVCS
jgi:hypothetical protein